MLEGKKRACEVCGISLKNETVYEAHTDNLYMCYECVEEHLEGDEGYIRKVHYKETENPK